MSKFTDDSVVKLRYAINNNDAVIDPWPVDSDVEAKCAETIKYVEDNVKGQLASKLYSSALSAMVESNAAIPEDLTLHNHGHQDVCYVVQDGYEFLITVTAGESDSKGFEGSPISLPLLMCMPRAVIDSSPKSLLGGVALFKFGARLLTAVLAAAVEEGFSPSRMVAFTDGPVDRQPTVVTLEAPGTHVIIGFGFGRHPSQ